MLNGIVGVGLLNTTLSVIYPLTDFCVIDFEESGITIPITSDSGIASALIELNQNGCESYTSDGYSLGVNLQRIKNILQNAPNNSQVHFNFDEEDRRFVMNIDGQEYKLGLIEQEHINNRFRRPELDLSTRITIENTDFDRSVKAADMLTDYITLRVDEESRQFIMEAMGDVDITRQELNEDDLVDATFGRANSTFSLDYLSEFNKCIPEGTNISIDLGYDRPCIFSYKFADDQGDVQFVIAPRIED